MKTEKYLLSILKNESQKIEAALDSAPQRIWTRRSLKYFLSEISIIKEITKVTSLNLDQIILFLLNTHLLHQVTFLTPREERLYYWRIVDEYELFQALRPNGYYSHMTALYLHGLLVNEPNDIYFNNEQPARPSPGNLEQSRIDNAFRNRQRITTAKTSYASKVYWLLSGKQTGNYGVIRKNNRNGIEIPVTDLERTLIDITVRPAYAGGTESVLRAYRLAKPKISIEKLSQTLRTLNYSYPYFQSIGFYVDFAANYDEEANQEFLKFQPFKYDFYLDYGIKDPSYSPKWRIYYPSHLK